MIGQRLSLLRKEKKKRQEDIAKVIGITRPAYTAYEKGKRSPDYDTLIKLAAYYNVTTDYLLGISDERDEKILNYFGDIEKRLLQLNEEEREKYLERIKAYANGLADAFGDD